MNRQGEMTQNETNILLVLFYLRVACLFRNVMVQTTYVELIMGHFSSSQTGQARPEMVPVCAVSNQTKYETYELKQLKWLGRTSTSHSSMASKRFNYHSRSQTHDALMLMNSAHNLFDIHFAQMEYEACHAEVEFEISLRGISLLKMTSLPSGKTINFLSVTTKLLGQQMC